MKRSWYPRARGFQLYPPRFHRETKFIIERFEDNNLINWSKNSIESSDLKYRHFDRPIEFTLSMIKINGDKSIVYVKIRSNRSTAKMHNKLDALRSL